jgi:hypothetical protein
MSDRFRAGEPPRRLLRRDAKETNRARRIPAPLEMERELGGDLVATVSPRGLLRLSEPAVKTGSAGRRQTPVEDPLMERVNEVVPAAGRAVRGRVETSRIDQARGSRKGLQALVDRIRIEPERGRYGARGKLATDCASCL